ncbi:hypothetical protein OAN90_03525 [Gammaproteobacteria bacterium]|jgi:hypothetical protein|nr:hypothetical protein [Gammaproteobacteria bacterium]|tara:strand:- start:1556 stop:1840 length:285 start_codon:yes stop_codon:yes gene_type:complete
MAELSLSTEIVNKVLEVIKEHDSTSSDQLVASQYLAAIIGFVVAKENFSDEQRNDVINELSSFIRHVADDIRGESNGPSPVAPAGDSFGIWKPE